MHIGRMKNEVEAQDYIIKRLEEVKEILDDIADQTGQVYICFGSEFAETFGRFGQAMIGTLTSIMSIIPDRMVLANKAREIAIKADEDEAKAKKQEGLGL